MASGYRRDTPANGPSTDRDWEAERDLRTLIEAEEIKGDKARYKAALKERDEMKKQLGGIRGQAS